MAVRTEPKHGSTKQAQGTRSVYRQKWRGIDGGTEHSFLGYLPCPSNLLSHDHIPSESPFLIITSAYLWKSRFSAFQSDGHFSGHYTSIPWNLGLWVQLSHSWFSTISLALVSVYFLGYSLQSFLACYEISETQMVYLWWSIMVWLQPWLVVLQREKNPECHDQQ